MSQTAPYGQHHYLGEFATDAEALTDLRANKWDSTKNGLGNPEPGMLYYNTTNKLLMLYGALGWQPSDGPLEQGADESTRTTTFAAWQDAYSHTTGALPAGTYQVNFYCELAVAAANKGMDARLYNSTDATELCLANLRPTLKDLWRPATGFYVLTFAGAAKTLKVQWCSPDGSSTVSVRRARLTIRKAS